MKIAFLIRALSFGGAERQLVALTKGLHQQGHSILVIVFYPDGPLEQELRAAGIPVRSLDKKNRWDVIGFIWRLIKLIKKENPNILHGYLGTSNILAAVLRPIFPSLKTVWSVRASELDFSRYDWLMRVSYYTECKLSRFAHLIISNSKAGLNYAVSQGFPKNKMAVIPNGIDHIKFAPDLSAGRKKRQEWGIKDGQKLIGLVGRLDPMKDHSNFIRAAAILANERDDVRFVCVGDGPDPYRQELFSQARALNLKENLIWAGALKDVKSVYNAMDIVTSSSIGEGFPNVIGEAMACGIPCVVTDVGGSSQVIGETGLLVSPGNPEELANGWKTMLERLQKEESLIKEKTRNRIVEEFTTDKLTQRTIDVLEKLL